MKLFHISHIRKISHVTDSDRLKVHTWFDEIVQFRDHQRFVRIRIPISIIHSHNFVLLKFGECAMWRWHNFRSLSQPGASVRHHTIVLHHHVVNRIANWCGIRWNRSTDASDFQNCFRLGFVVSIAINGLDATRIN